MKHGYHRLLLSGDRRITGPLVVETTRDGKFAGWHLLRGEEPFVEWKGGDYNANSVETKYIDNNV